MLWFTRLFSDPGAAQAVVALCLVTALGLALGSVRVRGIRLGVGGVLFSGLALAHCGMRVEPEILEFVREFGLIFFVYAVGMQVGPGFAASLRRRGLSLNLFAVLVVLSGLLISFGLSRALGLPAPAAVGMFCGAVTNTPSLAASSQVFAEAMPPEAAAAAVAEAGMAYAAAYPFGFLGLILTLLLLRLLFRIQPGRELETLRGIEALWNPPLRRRTFVVRNADVFGMSLRDFFGLHPDGAALSWIKAAGEERARAPAPETALAEGMLLSAVGDGPQMEKMSVLIGPPDEAKAGALPGRPEERRLLLSKSEAAGKTVQRLWLTPEFGVAITRLVRAGVELAATPATRLHYGDSLFCVGGAKDLERAAAFLGNSAKALEHPRVLPVFLGIFLGVILGSIPVYIPGFPAALKLGLAGGPLLAAILLSRLNNFAGMVWYLPTSANLILREAGIALFLACVGLNSGRDFAATLTQGAGLVWMAAGAAVTFAPLFSVALLARIVFKYDYATICGLLTGSMTDPPALAFSVQSLDSDAPTGVYAAVYPLTMMLRILFSQILVFVLLLWS
ncbi:MAG: putative transporter [Deltaproteobacteria bacterium]|nr:putative transporter [Deltaproteobacteria bacterium]